MLDGPHVGRLLRRLWPLNLGVCLGAWLGAALLAGIGGRHGDLALGVAFATGLVMPSLLAVVVSLAGMRLGQAVCARLRPQGFRLCFFLGLLALGAYLALRGLG